jgi:2-hydroxy-6-oxonona-2,4-dienedioate hydrolase
VAARFLWPALAAVPHELGYLPCGGITTRCLLAGPADAPCTIFLHGFGSQIETFGRNIGPHAERRRVVVFDLLGHGFTDAPDRPYEIADYLEHLAAVRSALGIVEFDLVGVALGAWAAARCAAQEPKAVRRLTLCAPGGMTSNPEAMERVRRISLAAAHEPTAQTARERLSAVLADPGSAGDDLVETRLDMARRAGAEQAMCNILCLHEAECRARNLLTPDELRRIACPTLVVSGGDDRTSPPQAGRAFSDAIGGARHVVLEAGAHWSTTSKPMPSTP